MSPTRAVQSQGVVPRQKASGSERRSHRRFQIAIPVEYVVGGLRGTATTSDISRRGVFIRSDQPLPVGEMATLLLDWPAKLNEDAALWLQINGEVLRNDENGAAISVACHKYRVRKRHIAGRANALINVQSGNNGENTLDDGATQRSSFLAGINGVQTSHGNGRLATINSSRRCKENIADMGDASNGLMCLRPVTFRYQEPLADGSKPVHFGLIPEEVAEVYPDLVTGSGDGETQAVNYQALCCMLLNEVQHQQKQIQGLEQQNAVLGEWLAKLEAALAKVMGVSKLP